MTDAHRPPRVWIDFESGVDHGSTAGSLLVFQNHRTQFTSFEHVWLFAGERSPLARGFYYPPSAYSRHGVSRDQRGPGLVLIDDRGDQLWLSGVACGDEYERTEGALTVLQAAGFVPPPVEHPRRPLAGYDEMHFREGRLVAARPTGEAVPMSPSGRTAVINGRLVNRLDFDGDTTTPADIWALWLLATEADGWLGHPVSLVLYDSRATSESAHHTGCQLIATGSTGRELWLVLPEADQYDSLSPFPRRHYQGSYVEYSQVVSDIFRYVGADIVPPDRRPRWRRLLGQYDAPPSVIRWPGGSRRAPGVWRPAKRTAPGSG